MAGFDLFEMVLWSTGQVIMENVNEEHDVDVEAVDMQLSDLEEDFKHEKDTVR